MAKTKVTVIILNWNGINDTIKCLESLKKIDYPNYDVVVIDNGSEGDDVKILKQKYRDWIYLIENDKNYGAAEGRNIGIRFALENLNQDCFLFLDNDTIVYPNFLSELIKIMNSNKGIGIVGAKELHGPLKKSSIIGRFFTWTLMYPFQSEIKLESLSDDIKEVVYQSSCAMLIRKEVIEKAGLFDPRFIISGGEYDLCLRVHKSGYKVCSTTRSKIWHKRSSPNRFPIDIHYFRMRNAILLMKKHATLLGWIKFLPFFIINLCIRVFFYLVKLRFDVV